jgi:hypothetical protein
VPIRSTIERFVGKVSEFCVLATTFNREAGGDLAYCQLSTAGRKIEVCLLRVAYYVPGPLSGDSICGVEDISGLSVVGCISPAGELVTVSQARNARQRDLYLEDGEEAYCLYLLRGSG